MGKKLCDYCDAPLNDLYRSVRYCQSTCMENAKARRYQHNSGKTAVLIAGENLKKGENLYRVEGGRVFKLSRIQ